MEFEIMKVFQTTAFLAVLLAAPALAATLSTPEIQAIEEGNVIRFASAPVDGVALPASSGKPHICDGFYPAMATRWYQQGDMLLEFIIQPDGSATGRKITKSAGSKYLDQAGLACVSQWTYRPAMQNGRPVAALNTVKIMWRLK
jgi:TonB family protein